MDQHDPWQVMATHTIHYKGEVGKVEVVQVTHRAPEFFFHVRFPGREILLCRFAGRPEIWNGSPVTLAEAKALGESIEQQIGYRLPVKADNNPFLYQGDLDVPVEHFRIGTLLIERAKAPYTSDIYYRIVFSEERKVVLVYMDVMGERSWTFEGAWQLDEKVFHLFKSMLQNFEEAYQLGMYTAER